MEIVLEVCLGAVILTGDLNDFRTVLFWRLGPLRELSGAVTYFYISESWKLINSAIVSGQRVLWLTLLLARIARFKLRFSYGLEWFNHANGTPRETFLESPNKKRPASISKLSGDRTWKCVDNWQFHAAVCVKPEPCSETGRIRFRGVRFQTPNSVSFFGAHWVPGSELSEFLSAYYLCAKANSTSFSQNSPSLP